MKNGIEYTSFEAIKPEDLDGRVLVMKTASREVNAAAVTRELIKVFPNLSADQILIMPDDFKLLALGRKELVAQLRGMLRRFDPDFK